ncbi:probable membrane-associated kinase regulator 1 [Lycium ferocissimum]|uniref:probable membrane-associated kinase regulator 1 n=1 Tax=Lycium ferocissimum TaxID=112874 RepID=UPI002814C95F|nr:probable membrane-associated kinase regulator 1 [Lycium ferocissimum]
MMKNTRESEEIVLLKEEEEEEEDEEEALSLCDLPNNEENQTKKEACGSTSEVQLEDFDFNSCGGNMLKESEMCTADEIFYQGQILPLRHSVSLPSDRPNCSSNDANSSSRSSSIRSQRSSSSGSSSNSSTTCSKYKPKVRNQFHSHPSPTPQVRFSKSTIQSNVNNSSRKSTLWSLFRVGLVTTPEIALQDLKNRSNRDNSGSRNSTSSSSSGSFNNNDNTTGIILSKKKKQRFSLGSCKCSANAVATVPSNVLIMNSKTTITKTRKATSRDHEHEDKKDSSENIKATKKQAMSRHRTFEWLKQLSLEGPSDET